MKSELTSLSGPQDLQGRCGGQVGVLARGTEDTQGGGVWPAGAGPLGSPGVPAKEKGRQTKRTRVGPPPPPQPGVMAAPVQLSL